jgi:hypothetical protein
VSRHYRRKIDDALADAGLNRDLFDQACQDRTSYRWCFFNQMFTSY